MRAAPAAEGFRFRLLGPLEVTHDGEPVPLGAGKQRALLAVLLLNGNRAVATERLIDDLWGEDAPDSAPKMVQIHVSQLRKALPGERIRTLRPGYLIDVGEDELDLTRFEQLARAARQALAGGSAEEAAARLREALALWRGDALAEFAEPFAAVEARRIEGLRLAALEERIEADLALGRHVAAAAELEALVARDPLREPLRRRLMIALYRSGRQADALAAFTDFRVLLDEQLGIEPSAALRALERQILQQDPALDLVAAAEPAAHVPAAVRPPLPARAQALAGRAADLALLDAELAAAVGGERALVFVSGEAGIGKTTLVDRFADALGDDLLVARGQCIEQRGAGEPYMPLLDALGRLARGAGGPRLVELLHERGPSWLVQLPWLVAPGEAERLEQRVRGTTRERMLRELVEVLETLTTHRPLVLVLEDLHWSDVSTLDVLGALAGRREPARLLVIGTFRSGDATARGRQLPALIRDLSLRRGCTELRLGPLSEDGVAEYLASRDEPVELAGVLHTRSGGNPLFMSLVVDTLTASLDAAGRLDEESSRRLPETLRQLIEQELDGLGAEERQLLEAASVVGGEFSSAAVAAAAEREEEAVEDVFSVLARESRLVRARGETEWPDGTIAARFEFAHDLHREVLYGRIPTGRRARLHRLVGSRLETAYGARAADVAGELAGHYVSGREPSRAIRFLRLAAESASRRRAHREAIAHLEAALRAVPQLPDTPERARAELELRSLLGQAYVATKGWSAPEVERSLQRARELCAQLGDSEPAVPVLVALATVFEVRGEYRRAETLVDEAVALAAGAPGEQPLEWHELLACSFFHQGSFERALEQAELGAARFGGTSTGHYETFPATIGDNGGVACHDWAALALWFLGYPERALARARLAIELAEHPSRAYGLASARAQLAMIHQCRLEPDEALRWADGTIAVAAERGYAYRVGMGTVVRGWALAALGDAATGVGEIEHGLELARSTGVRMDDVYFLGLLADACLRAGRIDRGLAAVAEATTLAEREQGSFYDSELRRLQAALRASAGATVAEVEADLHDALRLAQSQRARTLELRAAVDLVRLLNRRGDGEQGRRLLASLHGAFREGHDTADLSAAAGLLDDLAATAS